MPTFQIRIATVIATLLVGGLGAAAEAGDVLQFLGVGAGDGYHAGYNIGYMALNTGHKNDCCAENPWAGYCNEPRWPSFQGWNVLKHSAGSCGGACGCSTTPCCHRSLGDLLRSWTRLDSCGTGCGCASCSECGTVRAMPYSPGEEMPELEMPEPASPSDVLPAPMRLDSAGLRLHPASY